MKSQNMSDNERRGHTMIGKRANDEHETQAMNEDSIINQMDDLAVKDAIDRNMGFIREFLWILGEPEISENFE